MPKGYVVAMVSVTDVNAYKPYMEATETLVRNFGGKYLIRGAPQICKENSTPHERFVVIEFPSFEQANSFYNDERYVEVRKIRQNNSEGFLFLTTGVEK